MIRKALAVLALLLLPVGAFAQTAAQSDVGFLLAQGSTYGSYTCPSTAVMPCFVQYGATVPVSGTLTPSGTQNVAPASRTPVTLDVKTVTTGGTAVTALTAGHRTFGGFLQNPPSATVNLCINEIGTAAGTTSSGDTTCIQPGAAYKLTPATTAVSVISSDSAHPFSGYGLN